MLPMRERTLRCEFRSRPRGPRSCPASCDRRPVWHLARIEPRPQLRLRDPARSRQRALRVLEAGAGQLADALLDRVDGFSSGLKSVRYVPDGGARVGDEVGQRRDPALSQHLQGSGRVGHVRSRRHDPCAQRARSCLIDDADSGAGDDDVRIDVEQIGGGPDDSTQVVYQVVAVTGPQIQELVDPETDRASNTASNGGKRHEAGSTLRYLHGGGATDFAETLDGDGAFFEAA